MNGKHTVFLLSRKINSEFFKKLNVSDNSESYLLVIWLTNSYSDFVFFSDFCHPNPRPTTLQSYLTYYV